MMHIYSDEHWSVRASKHAQNTANPIRQICDTLKLEINPEKQLIKLNLGDPSLSDEFPHCDIAEHAITEALLSRKYVGYGPATGIYEAKKAIARHFSCPEAPISPESVVLANGCSHALMMAIEVLADSGDNILVPAPGFSLYSTLMRPLQIENRLYDHNLTGEVPSIDFKKLTTLIDERTRAIILNNPSNPTGSVFDKQQLEVLLKIAQKYRLPIIADEVYGTMVYNNARFYPIATLKPKVPILACNSIAKRYLLPGWRLGWLIVHDPVNAFAEVCTGLNALAQKIVGPCVLIQAALPTILDRTPATFFEQVNAVIGRNASIVYEQLCSVPGLRPLMPNGAMYMMIAIDQQIYGSDEQFVRDLLRHQSVFCLPGSVFHRSGWFRMVLIYSEKIMREACDRISQFCHARIARNRIE